MNKKIILSTVLIAIIASALATWFIHNQLSDLQNQIDKLQAQNSELQNQISELATQKGELQDQIAKLQNQLIELENMINARDVKITNFEWIGGYHSLGQVNLFQNFKVTIQNMGNNTVSGLTVSVKLLSVETNAEIDEYTTQINITRAGQIVEIYGDVWVGNIGSYAHTAVGEVTLTWSDVLLDQWTRNLQGSFG
jgi:predicted RNase H-like nuclease (RuvC/YqgF family)